MFNAPIRPSFYLDAQSKKVPFQYRIFIDNPHSKFCTKTKASIEAQVRLYRWLRGIDYENGVALGELADYLKISKRSMGQCITQAMRYDPRKLKGGEGATIILVLPKEEELWYGLEWQICSWLTDINGKVEDLEEDLYRLAFCSERKLQEDFLEPFFDSWEDCRLTEVIEEKQRDGSYKKMKVLKYPMNKYIDEPDWLTLQPIAMKEERERFEWLASAPRKMTTVSGPPKSRL